ncbi:MbcA/ParS/Xre antitoxin family protein [Luteimonas sp. BDR2-5]|uniref:MbcA/ParS/Xre antitoxin family protein n=1 Tax=Proluteimonas luteida TaxID=2878685 RepID=UPI001E2A6A0A|nr:MbcA/ParS/Xre antitoxin family protein [Luteimonas sp. BDR2-5]MCD9027241.1 MbcA/ParS/Xre antitoxin family protein [Luteimonas sp. BDR2-5]
MNATPAHLPLPTRRDLAAPALKAFFNIAQRWGLSAEQERRLLGSPGRSTFFRWKRDLAGAVPGDALERISYLLGIYKALHILFPDDAQADGWVRRPNSAPPFGGTSALDRMLGGRVADLYVVREYLDAQRGWN